jgi:hypothetical protein
MALPEIYEQLFGKTAATKQADEAAEVKEEAAAEAAAETAVTDEAQPELTDEQIDQALAGMSEDELGALAKEVAADVKESKANEQAAIQKEAEELYAAGRIFGQGFIAEVNGKTEKVAETNAEPEKKGVQKFAALLEKELKAEPKK